MKTATLTSSNELGVWLRILYPDGKITQRTARAILRLSFPVSEKKRMHDLSTKARAGILSEEEENEMDAIERAGSLLSILKSKARMVLKETERTS
jgi:hypothetical protein